MRVCSQIERTFGKRLPLVALLHAPSVEQLAGVLEQEWPEPIPSLVALQSKGSKPPFFWVHGENSNAFLPHHLGPDQPLYGLLQQGRDGTRALYTTIEDIAAYYLRGLRSVQPSGPYFLGGYCVGGILAFEMAQQLRKQAQEVALLLLLDPPPTGHGRSSRSHGERSPSSSRDASLPSGWARRQFRNLALRGPKERLAYIWDGIASRTRGQLTTFTNGVKKVASEVYLATGIERPVSPSLRVRYLNAVHSRAKRNYVPDVYPGRVVVLRTEGGSRDLAVVWGRLAAGGLEIHEVPGQHTEIVFDKSQIQVLATHLKACLDRAQLLE